MTKPVGQSEASEPNIVDVNTTPEERFNRAMGTGLRYKRERDEARERVAELERLVRRAGAFVNAVACMAEDRTPALAWIADAAKALPRHRPSGTAWPHHEWEDPPE